MAFAARYRDRLLITDRMRNECTARWADQSDLGDSPLDQLFQPGFILDHDGRAVDFHELVLFEAGE